MNDDQVKVRIAVAVDRDGNYTASGCYKVEDQHAFDWIIDDLQPGELRYFINATLRKPKIEVLEAEVDSIAEDVPGTPDTSASTR